MNPTEVYPAIHCDIALGEKLSRLSIDAEQIRERMVEGGMTPEQIGATTIYFSAGKQGLNAAHILGDYNPRNRQIRVFYEPIERHVYHALEGDPSAQSLFASYSGLTMVMNETMLHETKHRINDATGLRAKHHRQDYAKAVRVGGGLIAGGLSLSAASLAANFDKVLPYSSWPYLNAAGLVGTFVGALILAPGNPVSRRFGPVTSQVSREELDAVDYESTHDDRRGHVVNAVPLEPLANTCLE